jgi:hypothetical protein
VDAWIEHHGVGGGRLERQRRHRQPGVEQPTGVDDQERGVADAEGVGADEAQAVARPEARRLQPRVGQSLGGVDEVVAAPDATLAEQREGDVGEVGEVAGPERAELAGEGGQARVERTDEGGFEASNDPSRYLRYVPAAKRRYPNEPALAFPTATRRYGVQNFYVEHLADLGVVGLLLLAAVYAASLALALRRLQSTGAVIGLLWTLVVIGLWIAQGIVAGLPLDALTWLSFGLAARG